VVPRSVGLLAASDEPWDSASELLGTPPGGTHEGIRLAVAGGVSFNKEVQRQDAHP